MKTRLERHFSELSSAFRKDFRRLSRNGSKKAIHALRVTIKRLRTFLLLLEHLAPEKIDFKKSYRRMSKLFSEAGRVRNLHVQAALLNKFDAGDAGIDGIKHKLKTKARKRMARFKKVLRKFDERKALLRIKAKLRLVAAAFDERTLNRRVRSFAKENIMNSIARAEENSIHDARRKLKEAHYALEIIRHDHAAARMLRAIDRVEKNAGKWQDCMITLHILDKAAKKQNSSFPAHIHKELTKEITAIELQIKSQFRRLAKLMADTHGGAAKPA